MHVFDRKVMPDISGMPLQKQQVAEEHQHQQNGKAKMPKDEDFDHAADRHRGQLALRKLYHESDRLLLVLYTSPSCGPCRTLKPIFSKVVDDYPGKVRHCSMPSSCPAPEQQFEAGTLCCALKIHCVSPLEVSSVAEVKSALPVFLRLENIMSAFQVFSS